MDKNVIDELLNGEDIEDYSDVNKIYKEQEMEYKKENLNETEE